MKIFRAPLLLFIFSTAAFVCTAQTWKGKIVYGYGDNIKQYDLSAKTDKVLLPEAQDPFLTPAGEIYFINQNFRKKHVLVRKSNSSATQFRDVLDMSSENPKYKQQLEDYSIIRKTGNSGVMDRMLNPKVSPNGKYLSVTIHGYGDQVFNKEGVGVFDLASGELLTKYDGKYYGSWTPDNKLVMAGADKWGSVNETITKGPEPGIFITDNNFTTLTRIDPGFDDPSPYHPSVSPDGKQVAFILNNHVWAMGINGENPRQITAVDNDNNETYPTWSPDAKYIACWVYKTFEKSYFTAVAIVPAATNKAVVLTNTAAVWPKDKKNYRISGGAMQLNWKYDRPVSFATAPNLPNAHKPGVKKAPAPVLAPAPPAAPAVGSKVKIAAENGQTYTGVVTQVKNGEFKVRYDGHDFEAWLTRDQFELIK